MSDIVYCYENIFTIHIITHLNACVRAGVKVKSYTRNSLVDVLYAYAGAEPEQLDDCVKRGARGIAIACVGNGNLRPVWRERIRELAKQGIVVVRCSRANGFVNRNGAQNDDMLGTVSGGNLSAQESPYSADAGTC